MIQFNPIPMTYSQLYPSLIHKGLVVPRGLPSLLELYPHWYDPNSHCEYHEGALGHSLDVCLALKLRHFKCIWKDRLKGTWHKFMKLRCMDMSCSPNKKYGNAN